MAEDGAKGGGDGVRAKTVRGRCLPPPFFVASPTLSSRRRGRSVPTRAEEVEADDDPREHSRRTTSPHRILRTALTMQTCVGWLVGGDEPSVSESLAVSWHQQGLSSCISVRHGFPGSLYPFGWYSINSSALHPVHTHTHDT